MTVEEILDAFKGYKPIPRMTTFKRFKNPIETALEGFELVKEEMQEKGLLTDKTTFEEMADYAGKHVILTERKK